MVIKKFEQNQKEIAEIIAISGGFQKALILQVAVNNDLFTFLSKTKGGNVDSIAQNFKWDKRSTRIFLNALTAIGFLVKADDSYKNTEKSEKYLVEGKEIYMGDIIKHTHNMLQNTWRKLETVLETGRPAIDRSIEKRDDEELRNFILGMANNTRISINQLLSQIDLSKFRKMLDIGGGPGTYSICFCEKYPHLKAVVFDLPEVIPILHGELKKYNFDDRISSLAGDYLKDDIGKGYDLVFISNIIHSLSLDEIKLLFKKSYNALIEGGEIYVKDFVPDDDRNGPEMPLIFAVNMLVATERGDTYTKSEIVGLLSDVGFSVFKYYDITTQSLLITAKKS